jgi:beta-alanine degradation protein BauB
MRVWSWLLLIIMVAAIPAITSSQSSSPQSPVEISGEPRHHPKFENEFVRIWDVTVPAGEATLWHAHRNDNVVVTLGDASLRIENATAAPAESQWKFGQVRFAKATYIHRAINIGTTPFHNLTIELLKSPPASPEPSAIVLAPRQPILENDRVRLFRVSLAPGESLPMHRHPVAGLAVTLSASEIAISTEGSKQVQKLKVSEGDVRWRPGPVTHSIQNIGKSRFEAVDIELK